MIKKAAWVFLCFPVPGANLLADIAPENLLPNRMAQVFRDVCAVFNGQVRDAAGCIDCPVGQDAAGWASFQAALTIAAMLSLKGLIGLNLQGGEDFSQEQPGTELRVDQAAILPDPSQTSPDSHFFFQDGRCVRKSFECFRNLPI